MRIMSWNIQWGKSVTKARPGTVDISAIVERIQHWSPDIVCLQEVCVNFPANTEGRNDDHTQQLKEALPDYHMMFAPTTDWYSEGCARRFGNAIFSRHRVICSRAHVLPAPHDIEASDTASTRSAVEAWIATPEGKVLRLVCVHLEYASRLQRSAQIEYLASVLAQPGPQRATVTPRERTGALQSSFDAKTPLAAPPTAHFNLMCGDFNCPPHAPELAVLTQSGLHDLWAVARPDESHAPTISVHYRARPEFQPECFDLVFGRADEVLRGLAVQVDDQTLASDHQPVIVDMLP